LENYPFPRGRVGLFPLPADYLQNPFIPDVYLLRLNLENLITNGVDDLTASE
jgi:hypothetical protein